MGCICTNGNNPSSLKSFNKKWKEGSIINTTQINIINANKKSNNYVKIKKPFNLLTSNESWRNIIDYLSPKEIPIIGKCNK